MSFQFKWMGNIYSSKRVRWPDGKAFKTKKEENLALGTHAQAFFSYANFFLKRRDQLCLDFGLGPLLPVTRPFFAMQYFTLFDLYKSQRETPHFPFQSSDWLLYSEFLRLMTTAVLKQPFSIYCLWGFSFSTLTFLVFIKRLWGSLLGEVSGNKTLRKSVWGIKYHLV